MEGITRINRKIGDHEIVEYTGWNFYQPMHNYYLEDIDIPEHWHNSLEITYVVTGLKVQVTKGKKKTAGPGCLLLTNSGVLHSLKV